MPSRFAALTNRHFTSNQAIMQAVPEIHEEGDEVWGGNFNR